MIEINISRQWHGKTCVIGELSLVKEGNTVFKCYTLEEDIESAERGKDHRIPEGDYKAFWHEASRFKESISRIVEWTQEPLGLYNDIVPRDRYILIHQGNTHKDTEGCILLGMDKTDESVTQSRDAIKQFYTKLNRCDSRSIAVHIRNDFA